MLTEISKISRGEKMSASATISFNLLKIPKPSPRKTLISSLLTTPSKLHLKFTPNFKLGLLSHFTTLPVTRWSKSKPERVIRSLFTGIVEEMGEVKELGASNDGGFDMKIRAKAVLEGVHLGDSIAVNGTCLTATVFDTQLEYFTIGLSPETLRKTSLGELEPGSLVNLERAVQPTSRMGGHFVQGHVDGTGVIVSMESEEDSLWIKVKTDKSLLKYIVPKGFIAVDGASLTVVDVFDDDDCFNFMLVSYTQQKVVIPLKKVGQKVNLEVDILGKYVERLISSGFADSIKASS